MKSDFILLTSNTDEKKKICKTWNLHKSTPNISWASVICYVQTTEEPDHIFNVDDKKSFTKHFPGINVRHI